MPERDGRLLEPGRTFTVRGAPRIKPAPGRVLCRLLQQSPPLAAGVASGTVELERGPKHRLGGRGITVGAGEGPLLHAGRCFAHDLPGGAGQARCLVLRRARGISMAEIRPELAQLQERRRRLRVPL